MDADANLDQTSRTDESWMVDKDIPIDLHKELLPHSKVVDFMEYVEREVGVKEYCKGKNTGGRMFFQIYSREFVTELSRVINTMIREMEGPVLEVMAGDGKLTEFLRPYTEKEMIATDARIGEYSIAYPKWVLEMDAVESVRYYDPSLVLVCWEPFYSTLAEQIVEIGVPTLWIGDRDRCGAHSDLFSYEHEEISNRYALGRTDDYSNSVFKTGIYLFNARTGLS